MRGEFVHHGRPHTVHFGQGLTARIPELLEPDLYRKVYVIASARMAPVARSLVDGLDTRCAGWETGAQMHVPAEAAAATLRRFDESHADALLAIGGGSPIGLAKSVALERPVPLAAVPTTYAGSEMTAVWGVTRDGVKRTGRDENVRPRTVVYDVELTAGMPAHLTLTSGFNAIAHAMEGLYAPDATPLTDLQAEEGVRRMFHAVSALLTGDESPRARNDALVGAWLCGAVLGATSMSLHHRLCHVLGGTFGLPHAATHAVLLPPVLDFQAPVAGAMLSAFQRATRSADPAHALRELARGAGAPTSLKELGMPRAGLEQVAELVHAASSPAGGPVPDALGQLLDRAWRGVAR